MRATERWALKAVLGFWLLAGATIAAVTTLQNRKRRKSAVGDAPSSRRVVYGSHDADQDVAADRRDPCSV